MKVLNISLMVLRLAFLVELVLGILFWLNIADQLILLHEAVGFVVVIALWLIGLAQGFIKGGNFGLALATFIVGLALAIVGLYQQLWLPGSLHWIIQVIHLLLGLSAIGLGEMIAGRARRRLKALATM